MSGSETETSVTLAIGRPLPGSGASGPWHPEGGTYELPLWRKVVDYGPFRIPHYWMDLRQVYGDRQRDRESHQRLVDCFWSLCHACGAPIGDDVYQSYVLASLLPEARSNGSRRVLLDSRPRAVAGASRRVRNEETIQPLEQMLSGSVGSRLSLTEFRDQTATFLGPGEYDEGLWRLYRQMESELFDNARAILQQGRDGLATLLDRWRGKMRRIGRRRGNSDQKLILDILSYEARAAMHRCCSAAWMRVIQALSGREDWSPEADRFHRLWHLDQCWLSDDDRSNFHLFHGHIFGLHPACADFIESSTGRQLIGDWLASGHEPCGGEPVGVSAEDSAPEFERLLAGLGIAIIAYAERHQDVAEERRRQPRSIGGSDSIDQVQGQQIERDTGRRSPGR